jgi:uncharacterized membrane protein
MPSWTSASREEIAVALGPVEYLICSFPGNKFSGELAPAVAQLIDDKVVRILDLLFVSKDEDGTVHSFEIDQLDELAPFMELEGEAGAWLSDEDVEHAAEALEPNSSAVLLIWEDLWAAPFADALYNSGGVVLEGGRIPRDIIEAAAAASG